MSQELLDRGRDIITNLHERIAKLEHEVHELKRTRAESEAQAHVKGYREGQRDAKSDMRAMIGGSLGLVP